KDFRKHSWLDPNRDIYAYKSCRPDGKKHFAEKLASYANIKFRPAQGDYANYKVGAAADHVLMRVEEMYFIEIEATAHSNLSAAQTLLNDFMKLRILDGSYDCTTYSSLSDFINEVIFQKRVEFWGEGIIFFDLKRLGISTTRGYKGTNAPADYRLNADGLAPYWNFVISRGEILNHPSLIDFNNPDPSDTITPWIDK
ncbi:MAG: RagB/SusD family nutrient uptake outer membrane protein, partial [Rikenellaceae bacterium]